MNLKKSDYQAVNWRCRHLRRHDSGLLYVQPWELSPRWTRIPYDPGCVLEYRHKMLCKRKNSSTKGLTGSTTLSLSKILFLVPKVAAFLRVWWEWPETTIPTLHGGATYTVGRDSGFHIAHSNHQCSNDRNWMQMEKRSDE